MIDGGKWPASRLGHFDPGELTPGACVTEWVQELFLDALQKRQISCSVCSVTTIPRSSVQWPSHHTDTPVRDLIKYTTIFGTNSAG
jgi:hypothetical protein